MSNNHWALLERIQQGLNKVSDLPPTMMLAVADRLEETIAVSTREPLEVLAKQLADLFNTLLSVAPSETVNAVRGAASSDAPENAAYMLGQVSFAQLLASQAAERRVDDSFLSALKDRRYQSYLRVLFKQDCTGTELASEIGERGETVSRKLKDLRELGISDFRREGTNLCNFLTPTARTVLSEVFAKQSPEENVNTSKKVIILLTQLDPRYHHAPSFAPKGR
ncbi:helix-turn-helix domain-containing protein [Methylovulum psychrotolerans]|uniref:Uncharacterized protein n=1 Tax=Methylovulum psychrotolerans TaxID=1704499 RepID=A0A2S5CQH3_9GAMM|nr:helix-turn-helix domain-containing protein [Methylovulum psychrotolerans]POZ53071.1 hypothetical protein AADEFJLK_00080 [Methylovulum psychrotolerans]